MTFRYQQYYARTSSSCRIFCIVSPTGITWIYRVDFERLLGSTQFYLGRRWKLIRWGGLAGVSQQFHCRSSNNVAHPCSNFARHQVPDKQIKVVSGRNKWYISVQSFLTRCVKDPSEESVVPVCWLCNSNESKSTGKLSCTCPAPISNVLVPIQLRRRLNRGCAFHGIVSVCTAWGSP